MTGAYRKVLVKPGNLSWTIMRYKNDTDTLIRSDIEELRGDPVPKASDDGQLKALVLDFSLPASSYATMALREVLKADTSAAHQWQLQQAAVAKRQSDANVEASSGNDGGTDAKKPKLESDETDSAPGNGNGT